MLITIYTAILGLVTGLVYSFALGFAVEDGLLYGFVGGIVSGLFLLLVKKAVYSRNALSNNDTLFVSNYLLVLLLLVGIGSGLIV